MKNAIVVVFSCVKPVLVKDQSMHTKFVFEWRFHYHPKNSSEESFALAF